MGMDVHVTGGRKKDKKWAKMIKAKLACEDAGIDYPEDLDDYFEGETDYDEESLWASLNEVSIEGYGKGRVDYGDGFKIDLSDIPDNIKYIRVYMS